VRTGIRCGCGNTATRVIEEPSSTKSASASSVGSNTQSDPAGVTTSAVGKNGLAKISRPIVIFCTIVSLFLISPIVVNLKHQIDERNWTKEAWASLRQIYEDSEPQFNTELAKFDATVARVNTTRYGPELAVERAISLETYNSGHSHFLAELSKGDNLPAANTYNTLQTIGFVHLVMLSGAIDQALSGGGDWPGPGG
jgi:hypothetical protein